MHAQRCECIREFIEKRNEKGERKMITIIEHGTNSDVKNADAYFPTKRSMLKKEISKEQLVVWIFIKSHLNM